MTPSSDEFEIRILSEVVRTSQLVGFVRPIEDGDWLTENKPLFEIWRHPDGPVVKIELSVDGRLPDIPLSPGRYCFRASAKGFSPVTGRIDVRRDYETHALHIRLSVSA